MRHLFVPLLVVALIAVSPTVAQAGPADSSVQIRSSAELVTPTTIEVVVVVSCAPYAFGANVGVGFVSLNVNQAETGGNGSGGSQFPCDGQNHTLSLFPSPGPWQQGKALATAFACGFVCSDQVTKFIRID